MAGSVEKCDKRDVRRGGEDVCDEGICQDGKLLYGRDRYSERRGQPGAGSGECGVDFHSGRPELPENDCFSPGLPERGIQLPAPCSPLPKGGVSACLAQGIGGAQSVPEHSGGMER